MKKRAPWHVDKTPYEYEPLPDRNAERAAKSRVYRILFIVAALLGGSLWVADIAVSLLSWQRMKASCVEKCASRNQKGTLVRKHDDVIQLTVEDRIRCVCQDRPK